MSIAEKITTIAENLPRVFEAGENNVYATKFCTATVQGSGTNILEIDCPFNPDFIRLESWHPHIIDALPHNSVINWSANRRGFGRRLGIRIYNNNDGGRIFQLFGVQGSLFTTCFLYDEERKKLVVTSSVAEGHEILFPDYIDYIFVGAKYTDKTDYELLKELISTLPAAGGSMMLSQDRINETVSAEEWALLIADKPNWTFTWI